MNYYVEKADQSKRSAEKINGLVRAIHSAITATVLVTAEGRRTAESGIQLSQKTAAAFMNVTKAIEEVILKASSGVGNAINGVVLGNQEVS